jgi:hypothetical protein
MAGASPSRAVSASSGLRNFMEHFSSLRIQAPDQSLDDWVIGELFASRIVKNEHVHSIAANGYSPHVTDLIFLGPGIAGPVASHPDVGEFPSIALVLRHLGVDLGLEIAFREFLAKDDEKRAVRPSNETASSVLSDASKPGGTSTTKPDKNSNSDHS